MCGNLSPEPLTGKEGQGTVTYQSLFVDKIQEIGRHNYFLKTYIFFKFKSIISSF